MPGDLVAGDDDGLSVEFVVSKVLDYWLFVEDYGRVGKRVAVCAKILKHGGRHRQKEEYVDLGTSFEKLCCCEPRPEEVRCRPRSM